MSNASERANNLVLEKMEVFAEIFDTLGIGPVTKQILLVQMTSTTGNDLNRAALKVRQALKETGLKIHRFDYENNQPILRPLPNHVASDYFRNDQITA